MSCLIVIEILVLNKKWLVKCDLDTTLQEILSSFFQVIGDEIKADSYYSEQMIVVDKYSNTILHPYIQCSQLGLYNGIHLTII
ncbi:hypothetical protein SAMN02745191_1945 [Anaerorhabdus furcosa]|uniref:Uncharacterized protein n=1 Tax=Anaerorhabdus furcosa TaxID=118967 RepID=A0A1T4PCF4_9FIRM|nr:hypothetical protein SAMN02745191_1945 [Anaerorhabdus furcosa]